MFDSADTGAFVSGPFNARSDLLILHQALLVFKDPQNFRRQSMTLSSEYVTPRQIASIYEEVSGNEVNLLEMGTEDFLALDPDQYPFGAMVWQQ
jgi:hypothetical protein